MTKKKVNMTERAYELRDKFEEAVTRDVVRESPGSVHLFREDNKVYMRTLKMHNNLRGGGALLLRRVDNGWVCIRSCEYAGMRGNDIYLDGTDRNMDGAIARRVCDSAEAAEGLISMYIDALTYGGFKVYTSRTDNTKKSFIGKIKDAVMG